MAENEAVEEEGLGQRFSLSDVWAIVQMQRRVILASVVICFAVAAIYATTATRHYEAKSTVHISTLAVQEMEMGKSIANPNLAWNRELYIATQIHLLKTSKLREKILDRYKELGHGDGITAQTGQGLLANSMQVTVRQGTELLDIRVTTPNPQLSASLANLTAEVLRDENLARMRDAALDGKAWLEERLVIAEAKIDRFSAELVAYQQLNNLADVEESVTTLDARIGSLQQAYAAANTERVQQETAIRSYEELLRQGKYETLAKYLESPLIAAMWSSLASAIAADAEVKVVYLPKSKEYGASEARIRQLEQAFQEEVRRTISAEREILKILAQREQSLYEALNGGKTDLLAEQALREDYAKKRLDLDAAQTEYTNIKTRMNELDLQSETQLNNVRIVEEARAPKNASWPDVPTILLGGLGAGLVLGLALAGLREWLDDTITSPLDVSTYLRVPLLGMVPKIDEPVEEPIRTLYTHHNPKAPVAEAVRAMRTVIDLNPSGVSPRRLLVTSALSSEGKTSTTMRLSIAFANLNRRVLVIDADLRRPRVHKVFGGERSPGLSTLLVEGGDPTPAIRPTVVPNLFYMAAGPSHEQPNELLASRHLPSILAQLDSQFDLVVIDTPPCVSLSDARILSRHVDGVVMMCKEHSTSRMLVRESIRALEQVGARVLGVVVNEVDLKRRSSYSYYGYGYNYRYDGYSSDDDASDAAAK